jgi:hypothetical protein
MYWVDKICKTLIVGGFLYWFIGFLLSILFGRETADNIYGAFWGIFK